MRWSRRSPHRKSTKAEWPARQSRRPASVIMPFVNQIFDLESVKPVALSDFQNVSNRFCGRLCGGYALRRLRLSLRESFQSSFDELLRRAKRAASELLFQQPFTLRRRANCVHVQSVRDV